MNNDPTQAVWSVLLVYNVNCIIDRLPSPITHLPVGPGISDWPGIQ